jgi:hypothetical protein
MYGHRDPATGGLGYFCGFDAKEAGDGGACEIDIKNSD